MAFALKGGKEGISRAIKVFFPSKNVFFCKNQLTDFLLTIKKVRLSHSKQPVHQNVHNHNDLLTNGVGDEISTKK